MWSSDGIARLLTTVDAVRHYNNPGLSVAGVIVNSLESRTRRQRHWFDELVTNAPAPVWQPPVPKATWIAEAVEAGVGLDEFGTTSAAVLCETSRLRGPADGGLSMSATYHPRRSALAARHPAVPDAEAQTLASRAEPAPGASSPRSLEAGAASSVGAAADSSAAPERNRCWERTRLGPRR